MINEAGATLVMLSGGAHSLAVLLELLRDTDRPIHAHHVQLSARNLADDAAARACQQIVDYCGAHYRPIGLSHSRLDYGELSLDGIELACIAYEAGLAEGSFNPESRPFDRCIIAGRAGNERDDALTRHLRNCFEAATFPNEAPRLDHVYVSDNRAREIIPDELRDRIVDESDPGTEADVRREKPGADPARETTLVMLSGGTDSVYFLYKILAETDHEVLVHHMHNLNRERRHDMERRSSERVLAYLREHTRPFAYSESTIDHRSFMNFGMDFFLAAFTAGFVARDYIASTGKLIKGWVSGVCAEDAEETETRLRHLDELCAAACYPYAHPECVFMKPFPTKAEEIAGMPAGLARLAWSCRRPVSTPSGVQACGECHTCKIITALPEGSVSANGEFKRTVDPGFERWKNSLEVNKNK